MKRPLKRYKNIETSVSKLMIYDYKVRLKSCKLSTTKEKVSRSVFLNNFMFGRNIKCGFSVPSFAFNRHWKFCGMTVHRGKSGLGAFRSKHILSRRNLVATKFDIWRIELDNRSVHIRLTCYTVVCCFRNPCNILGVERERYHACSTVVT